MPRLDQRPVRIADLMDPDLRRVPSWNYLAVHCTVQAQLLEGEAAKDALQAKVDGHAAELEKVRKDAADGLSEAVKARVALIKTADDFKVDKADEMNDRQIKEAVIKAARGDSALDLSQKS